MKWLGACQLSAVGFRLSASGCRLLAIGFRRAFGNPPSPLRGPLPPDKQWGAREYIGARHPPLDRGGQGRSADFRLAAGGCWLSASGFRRAFGNPPSPLRGPLPPDKQWGAREYIGARHPPLDRGGQGRSADFRLSAFGYRLTVGGYRLSDFGFRLLASGFRLPASGCRLPAPDSRIPILHSRLLGNNLRRRILLTFIHGQFKIAIISKKQGREEYPCRNGKESSQW